MTMKMGVMPQDRAISRRSVVELSQVGDATSENGMFRC